MATVKYIAGTGMTVLSTFAAYRAITMQDELESHRREFDAYKIKQELDRVDIVMQHRHELRLQELNASKQAAEYAHDILKLTKQVHELEQENKQLKARWF